MQVGRSGHDLERAPLAVVHGGKQQAVRVRMLLQAAHLAREDALPGAADGVLRRYLQAGHREPVGHIARRQVGRYVFA